MASSSFIQQPDHNGNFGWIEGNAGGTYSTNQALKVVSDNYNNFYVLCFLENAAVIGGCNYPGGGYVIVKINSYGKCLWSMAMPYNRYSCFIDVDYAGALMVACPDSVFKVKNNIVQWSLPVKEIKLNYKPSVSEPKSDKLGNSYFYIWGDSLKIGKTHLSAKQKSW